MTEDSLFFYLREGKVSGPITADDVEEKVIHGEFNAMTLLYEKTEKEWRSLAEFEGFEAALEVSANPFIEEAMSETLQENTRAGRAKDPEGYGDWVVLRKTPGKRNHYTTIGPYDQQGVEKLLASGQILYSDFIWREGFKHWERISEESTFRSQSQELDQTFEEPEKEVSFQITSEQIEEQVGIEEAEEILSEQQRQETVSLSEQEVFPEEAEGEDLLSGEADNPVNSENLESNKTTEDSGVQIRTVTPQKKNPSRSSPYHEHKQAERSVRHARREVPRFAWLARWTKLSLQIFVGVLVVSFAVFMAFQSKIEKWIPTSELAQETQGEVGTPAQKVKSRAKTQPVPPVSAQKKSRRTLPKKPKMSPSYVKLIVKNEKTRDSKIFIFSNASFHYRAKLKVLGAAGSTQYEGHFEKTYSLSKKPGEDKYIWRARDAGLRPGLYTVSVQMGKFEQSRAAALGLWGNQFFEKRALVRKKLSPRHQKEKIELIEEVEVAVESVENLLRLSQKLSRRGSRSLRRQVNRQFRRLRSGSRGARKLWPEHWADLGRAVASLKALELKVRNQTESRQKTKRKISELKVQLRSHRQAIVNTALY